MPEEAMKSRHERARQRAEGYFSRSHGRREPEAFDRVNRQVAFLRKCDASEDIPAESRNVLAHAL
jgi:hypothetical protein